MVTLDNEFLQGVMPKLKNGSLKLFLYLLEHRNEDNIVLFSPTEACTVFNKNIRTIETWLDDLKDFKLLEGSKYIKKIFCY